jgi:hypothetical protein
MELILLKFGKIDPLPLKSLILLHKKVAWITKQTLFFVNLKHLCWHTDHKGLSAPIGSRE